MTAKVETSKEALAVAMGNYWSDMCEGKPALCTETTPLAGGLEER